MDSLLSTIALLTRLSSQSHFWSLGGQIIARHFGMVRLSYAVVSGSVSGVGDVVIACMTVSQVNSMVVGRLG